MRTMRTIINEWMIDNIYNSVSAIDLAQQAVDQFPKVIGIDTFVWDDADEIWGFQQLLNQSQKYE